MTESQPEIQPEHYSAQEFVRLQKQNLKTSNLKSINQTEKDLTAALKRERPNGALRRTMAASMICLGITLIGRKEGEYIGKGTKLDNIAALTEFERATRRGTEIFYSADLNPNSQFPKGLVAKDIDCPIIWAMLMEMVKNADPSFEGCIVNPTLRGGHLIFKASKIETTKIKALLNLGIKAEYLTNSVSVLAPGKYIFSELEKDFELSFLPKILRKHIKYNLPPIIDGSAIVEGFRNDTIFRWVNGAIKLDFKSKKVLACLLGRYFCSPPLDIEECLSIVKSHDDDLDNKVIELSKNEQCSTIITNDTELVQSKLKNKIIYDQKVEQFFEYSGTHWQQISSKTVLRIVEKILLTNAKDIQTPMSPTTTLNIARGHLVRIESDFNVPKEWKIIPHGINWQNGFLVLETGELLDHTPERWVTQVRETSYDRNELLSYENQKLIAQSCGGSIHKVNALLTCGNRVILPKPELETSYYFSGPAGSGKSLFTSCFMRLCGNQAVACEMADIEKGFSRADLITKNLIVFNEFIKMKDQNEKLIKSFIGRSSGLGQAKQP